MQRYTLFVRLIVIIYLIAFSQFAKAQQQGLYSQYMMNYYLINPAASGTENNLDVRLGYRMQWLGLSASPRNYYASAHYPINKLHPKIKRRSGQNAYHVVGGMFTGQTLGLLAHNSGYLTYAYHLPLTYKWIMSVGANVGFSQFSLNYNKMNWGDNITYDPSVSRTTSTNFDASLGIWIYSNNIFMGLSSMQILQNNLNFASGNAQGLLNRHYYFTGGAKLDVNEDITVVPSVMLRKTATAFQIDINTKVKFKDIFWAGVSYRKTDAFLALVGFAIPLPAEKPKFSRRMKNAENGRIEIGYSYDLITSRINQFSRGTHEIMVALVLPKKGKVSCPKFW